MIVSPPPPHRVNREHRYELKVFEPTGKVLLRSFSRNVPGIAGDLTASYHPLSGCIALTFSGRPDVLQLEGGEVVQLFLDDGDGFKPVFYGSVTEGAASEASPELESYTASGEDLLDGRECDDVVYRNQDAAAIAYDLALRCRHTALKVRASDFVMTGVIVPEVCFSGRQLGDALAELQELAAESPTPIATGVDASGFVFFRPVSSTLQVRYYDSLFRNVKVAVEGGIATAFRFVFGGQPSVNNWAGGYRPRPLSYRTIPDAELHDRYRRGVGRDVPQSAWSLVTDIISSSTGFTNPQLATDTDLATRAVRDSSGTPTFTLTNDDPWVFGIRLGYTLSDNAPATRLRIIPRHTNGLGPYFEIELPKADAEDKPLDVKLPPADNAPQGAFVRFETFRITAPVGGTFELYQAHLLRIDTDKLDAIARRSLSVPARRPSQLFAYRETPRGLRGYIAPATRHVELLDTPYGAQRGTVEQVRWVWNDNAESVETVLDLERAAPEEALGAIQVFEAHYQKRLASQTLSRKLTSSI